MAPRDRRSTKQVWRDIKAARRLRPEDRRRPRPEDTCGDCGAVVNAHTGKCPYYCNVDRAGAVAPLRRREGS